MEQDKQASPFTLFLPTLPQGLTEVSGGEYEEGLGEGKRETQTYSLEAIYSETLESPPNCSIRPGLLFLGVMKAAEVIETYLPLSKLIC